MAEVIKIIKASGGDFTTLNGWKAALSADPTDDQTASIEGVLDVTNAALALDTSNANGKTFKITVADGFRFYQGASWPDFRAARTQGANSSGDQIQPRTSNIIIEWLYIQGSNGAVSGNSSGTNLIVRNCCIWGQNSSSAITINASALFSNCFILASGTATSTCFTNVLGTVTINNCTMICQGSVGTGINRTGGTLTANNTIITTVVCYAGTVGGDHNMSTDTTAPGTTNWRSVTISTILASVSAGTEDFHMKSTAQGTYVGADLSGTIGTQDIDNQKRNIWDIGADRPVVSTSITITTTVTMSQVVGHVCDFPRSCSNTLTCSETNPHVCLFPRSLSSTLSMAQSVVRLCLFPRSTSDTVTFSESNVNISDYPRHTQDTLGLSQVESVSALRVRTVSHILSLSQTVSATYVPTGGGGVIYTKGVTTTLNLSQTLVVNFDRARNLTTTLSMTQAVTPTANRPRSVTNELDLSQGMSKLRDLARTVSQILGLTEVLVKGFQGAGSNTYNLTVAHTICLDDAGIGPKAEPDYVTGDLDYCVEKIEVTIKTPESRTINALAGSIDVSCESITTVMAVRGLISVREIESYGGYLKTTDHKYRVSRRDLEFVPRSGDKLVSGGRTYEIIGVDLATFESAVSIFCRG